MNNFNFYFCSNCGFHSSVGKCMLYGHKVSNDDFCNRHIPNDSLQACDRCGRLLTQPIRVEEGDRIKIYCRECYNTIK